jgi:hypothetical protein
LVIISGNNQPKEQKMKQRLINIKFNLNDIADVYQTIALYEDCVLSEKEVLAGLNNGEVLTSITTNGVVISIRDGSFDQIGKVIGCDIDGDFSYSNFTLEKNEDEDED